MKLTDYIVQQLEELKVDTVFGYIGGNIADLIDSICLSNIVFIQNYHEQASSFSANSYAQIKQTIGVAIASSGPGACNLINGIANAYFDSIPCIFITGNIHSKLYKSSSSRQNGFQETDIVSIVREITKFAVTITNADDVKYYFEKAKFLALEGRKGPVLLDIPYDVQRLDVDVEKVRSYQIPNPKKYSHFDTTIIYNLLKFSQRPLVLLGAGAGSDECRELIKSFLEKYEVPVVASLLGLDVLPHDHKCFVGFIGEYGNRYANLAVANCDVLLVLGSRLDERQIAGSKNEFAKNAKIIHVDIDKIELERSIPGFIKIHASSELFLSRMIQENGSLNNYHCWHQTLSKWRKSFCSEDINSDEITANNFLNKLAEVAPDNVIICCDVGQNQMAAAQSFHLKKRRRLLNSGGFGSMGYSLPAAIGAYYANNNTVIISINGDGGFQMNIQELQTIVREKLPILIVILNNRTLGMVKRLQDRKFSGRTFGTVKGYEPPEFSKIAVAYGIDYIKIDTPDSFESVVDFLNLKRCAIIEVALDPQMKTYPEPGISIDKQNPLLTDAENQQIQIDLFTGR